MKTKITEKDITDLEIQTSPNGNYKIYNYTIGMGAMGDDFTITKIFEKDEEFDINKGFNIWNSSNAVKIHF